MAEVLLDDKDWASLRLSHPEAWAQIRSDPELEELRDGLEQARVPPTLSGDEAREILLTGDDLNEIDLRLERVVRLGRRQEIGYFPDESAVLSGIENVLVEQLLKRDPAALDFGSPGVPDWAAQGRGPATPTPITFLNRRAGGIDIADGSGLRELGCGTYIDDTSGRRVVMVTDYSPFPGAGVQTLSQAIDPRNWEFAFEQFFQGLEGDGFTALPNGVLRGVFTEKVAFTFFPGFSELVETALQFDLYGDPSAYEDAGDPRDLPAMAYRLAVGPDGTPVGGDKKVLVDNGHAVINRLPDGTLEIESLKNIFFADPWLNAVSQYACWVWPKAIKDTVAYAGPKVLKKWPGSGQSGDSQPVTRTRLAPLGAGRVPPRLGNEQPDSSAATDRTEPGTTNRSDAPLDWFASYTDAVAAFLGRITKEQMSFSERLGERWTGNQEVTLDHVADDSIEFFEINTGLVTLGADLTVEWLEKWAKATQPTPRPDSDPPPERGEAGE